MTEPMSPPRVLIVDDDAVSLRFLAAAFAQSGCAIATADSGVAALAAEGSFDLLLIDRHLPDIDGADLLHALRERGNRAPAIATSAEIDAETADRLRTAGFTDELEKPASMRRIGSLLDRHLPHAAASLRDDATALAASGGDAEAVHALRGLLAKELEQLASELTQGDLAADSVRLGERLHRLRASCGFCGAVGLARFAADWQELLRAGHSPADGQRDAFLVLCRQTAAAMRGR